MGTVTGGATPIVKKAGFNFKHTGTMVMVVRATPTPANHIARIVTRMQWCAHLCHAASARCAPGVQTGQKILTLDRCHKTNTNGFIK